MTRNSSGERESLFTITKHKHNSKPIIHKLGGLPEGHTPITAGYPLFTVCQLNIQTFSEKKMKKNKKSREGKT